jgi:hypothetical protein
MMKKIAIFAVLSVFLVTGLFAIEVGLIGGTVTNPSHTTYGISSSIGFFVPLIKFEFELSRKTGVEAPEVPNVVTGGIKFRPKFGRFMPYAVLGVGTEFKRFKLDFHKYDSFTFVGGGLHYKVAGILSLRGDIRFLNFSDDNRVRFTAGLFLHL